uniref:ATP synthase complex subunit 8 n=1 Tax=Octostigma sinensis TaxID=211997 RepID=U3KTH0_9HEXA|nr:ATP synthase F0 subunit 8 [Octostigma sinensis]AEV44837.1 ATP synthase F0 subunit 8 [Octostigma sinensis]
MPQMAPMMWSIIALISLSSLLISYLNLFFFLNFSPKKQKKMNLKTSETNWSW